MILMILNEGVYMQNVKLEREAFLENVEWKKTKVLAVKLEKR